MSPPLPSTQADLCDGPLSSDECFVALNGMARGKSPESDGLPMEFYVKFCPFLGIDLVNVLNSCYLSGVMYLAQRRSLISLIFKKGDRLDPRNWRPITLLKCYYDENHIFSIEAILRHRQVACMRRKMLFTIFKYIFFVPEIFKFLKYASFDQI